MDGCPVIGNVSMGLVRKYVFAIFSGWHLVLDNKGHGKQKSRVVSLLKIQSLKISFEFPSLIKSFAEKQPIPFAVQTSPVPS
jgi:hypothetical protein